jgi:multidrug efflux pump subunit AcrB
MDRMRAGDMGLSEKEVMSNVITALTSNQMIAPSIWSDPRNGNNYYLTVQYPEPQIRTVNDLRSIPLHGTGIAQPTRLDIVSTITPFLVPTEVNHYQIRRKIDVYVRPLTEDIGVLSKFIDAMLAGIHVPVNVDVAMRGTVDAMNASFKSFGQGLSLSVLFLYLILVAQFRSFLDPFIILLALPPALSGVILT